MPDVYATNVGTIIGPLGGMTAREINELAERVWKAGGEVQGRTLEELKAADEWSECTTPTAANPIARGILMASRL